MPLRAVIKAGGSKGVDRDAVADLVAEVARLDEIVLVHGASAETDRIAGALGVPQEQITSPSGHTSRRTDRKTLEVFARLENATDDCEDVANTIEAIVIKNR